VTDDTRVFQIGMLALEDVVVRPAKTGGGKVDEHPSCGCGDRQISFEKTKLARLHAHAAYHATDRRRLRIHVSSPGIMFFMIIDILRSAQMFFIF
jgi:hypothetical protein